jgi:hypothetical protein
MDSIKWHKELTDGVVYNYFKNKDDLVNANYCKKMLNIGTGSFNKIIEHFEIQPIIRRAPYINFDTKLYSLSKMKEIKDKVEIKNKRVVKFL